MIVPMRTKVSAAGLASCCLCLSAPAAADLGPHSNFYEQNPTAHGQKNDIGVTLNRRTHQAYFYVTNFCLGSSTYSGHRYPNTVSLPTTSEGHTAGIEVVNGRVRWQGQGTLYDQSGRATTLQSKILATIGPRRARGSVTISGKCGKLPFMAKLAGSTK